MVDVSELVRFSAGERTLRLVMDIAAALERYKIVMEGPEGVRLRKLNHIRTIRGTMAIEGNMLTDAQLLRRIGPDKGGEWRVESGGGEELIVGCGRVVGPRHNGNTAWAPTNDWTHFAMGHPHLRGLFLV